MKIWHFALSILLFHFQHLSANVTPAAAPSTLSCALNPPSNFDVAVINSEWVDLTWTPVQGAVNYRVRTYDRTSGNLLTTVTLPGSAAATRIFWYDMNSGGGSNESRIWSVDGQGVESPTYSKVNYDKIILELVTIGITSFNNLTPCTLTYPANSCSNFTWGQMVQTSFRVTPPPGSDVAPCYFNLTGFIDNNYVIHYRISYNNVTSGYKINIDGSGTKFEVKVGNTLVATLSPEVTSPYSSSPIPFIYRAKTDDFTHVIKKIGVGPVGRPGAATTQINKRDLDTDLSISDLKTIPNPFKDVLTLELPDTDNQAATNVHLYDLLGAVKRTFTAPADQRTITFDTADLTPGVYFLRVETGGRIETIKVVKTQ